MHNKGAVYSKGRNVYMVRLSVMNRDQTGGFSAELWVKGNHWRDAKRYVEQMDPYRIWPNYPRLLQECGQEAGIVAITDKSRKECFYMAPERGSFW